MTYTEKLEVSIHNNLAILKAWEEGRIQVTLVTDDMSNSIYSINTIMTILKNNMEEAVTPVTVLRKKGEHRYEISETI